MIFPALGLCIGLSASVTARGHRERRVVLGAATSALHAVSSESSQVAADFMLADKDHDGLLSLVEYQKWALRFKDASPTSPSWVTKKVEESTLTQGANNTITMRIMPSVELVSGNTIVVSGLTGTGTADNSALPVGGAQRAKVGSTGAWVQSNGTMTFTVATSSPEANANVSISDLSVSILTFNLINPSAAQPAVTPQIAATGTIIPAADMVRTITAGGPAALLSADNSPSSGTSEAPSTSTSEGESTNDSGR